MEAKFPSSVHKTATSDAIATLPFDIVLKIAAYSAQTTISSLMRTNRDLYTHCAKFILQAEPVELTSGHDIATFLLFVGAEPRGKRWLYVRSLKFHKSVSMTSSTAQELARSILHATNLETLELRNAEKTLRAHPDLPLAIASLTSIKHVDIHEGSIHTLTMFEAMRWPLETARFTFTTDELPGADDDLPDAVAPRLNPASLLKNARTTLTSLLCNRWRGFSIEPHEYPVYSHLRSLELEGLDMPISYHWVRSYPNLTSLSVVTEQSYVGNPYLEIEDELYDTHRQSNLEGHWSEGSWAQLDTCTGTILDLYLLGLPCRVRRINTDLSSNFDMDCIDAVFEYARPHFLQLLVGSDLWMPGQTLAAVLQSPGLQDLTELKIVMCVFTLGEPGWIIDSTLASFLAPLSKRPIQKFHLDLLLESEGRPATEHYELDFGRPGDQIEPQLQPFRTVEEYMSTFDIEACVRRIFGAAPSIEDVDLDFRWTAWPRSGAKTVRAARAGTVVVQSRLLVEEE